MHIRLNMCILNCKLRDSELDNFGEKPTQKKDEHPARGVWNVKSSAVFSQADTAEGRMGLQLSSL